MRSRRSAMLVVGFVVVDLIVLALAWGLTHREDDASGSSTSTSTDDGVDRDPPIEGPLVLAAMPGGGLVRLTLGSCDSRERATPRVWVAPSFKAPLEQVTVPDLQQVLGVAVTDDRIAIVGAVEDCKVASFTSTDAGATWKQAKRDASVWATSTDSTKSALTGPTADGTLNLDCTPANVVTQPDGSGVVTCSGDTVLSVAPSSGKESGVVTTFPVRTPGGVVRTSPTSVLALGATDSCTDALVAVDNGQNQETRQVACFDDQDGAALGLAGVGQRVFAQIGYRLLVSTNGGSSFDTYPGQANGGAPESASASPSS